MSFARSLAVALGVGGCFAGLFFLTGCATIWRAPDRLAPFKSDGCSMFPDGTATKKDLWRECCVEHDIAYWQGGTKQDRKDADLRLRQCILQKTGDKNLAKVMYDAVRAWGSPIYPSWYRWGYGWRYGRPYGPLTPEEHNQVHVRLKAYMEELKLSEHCGPCRKKGSQREEGP